MIIEFQTPIIIIFIYLSMLATIGITCCIIDTVIDVKNYCEAKRIKREREMINKWGDIVNSKSNLGGGI